MNESVKGLKVGDEVLVRGKIVAINKHRVSEVYIKGSLGMDSHLLFTEAALAESQPQGVAGGLRLTGEQLARIAGNHEIEEVDDYGLSEFAGYDWDAVAEELNALAHPPAAPVPTREGELPADMKLVLTCRFCKTTNVEWVGVHGCSQCNPGTFVPARLATKQPAEGAKEGDRIKFTIKGDGRLVERDEYYTVIASRGLEMTCWNDELQIEQPNASESQEG